MIGGPNLLLDHLVVPLSFRHMLIGGSIIYCHIELIRDWFHQRLKLLVTVYLLNAVASVIIVCEHQIQPFIYLIWLVVLQWDETVKFDASVNGSKHGDTLHVHDVHT